MSKFYNEIAEKYDYIFPLSPAHQTFFASELCGKTVLDVGAAAGNLTAYLLSQGYEVTAIDLSERLIAEAAKKGIVVQPLNMLHIDQLAIFDNIVCIGNTLPHLDSKTSVQLFLQKAYEQLAQKGKLILQIVNFQKYFAQKQANDKVKFERFYYLNIEGKIIFKTILDDTIENEELLQPIFADELTQWLSKIGFQAINVYGNFKKDPFDPNASMALIIVAEK